MASGRYDIHQLPRLIDSLSSKDEEMHQLLQELRKYSTLQKQQDDDFFHSLDRSFISRDPDWAPPSIVSNSTESQRIRQQTFEANCMREAIQQQYIKLVNTLPFKETDLPEHAIEKGITDETESRALRDLPRTEDQVAGLVSTVLRQDLDSMNAFLDIIQEHNTTVVMEIREAYEYLKSNKVFDQNEWPCIVKELKKNCNIKWIYYYMFANNLISPILNERIIHSQDVVGSQDMLWEDMLLELRSHPVRFVLTVFEEAIKDRGNKTLLDMMRRLQRKCRPIKCTCDNLNRACASLNTRQSTRIWNRSVRKEGVYPSINETRVAQTQNEPLPSQHLNNLKGAASDTAVGGDLECTETLIGATTIQTANTESEGGGPNRDADFHKPFCDTIKDLHIGEKLDHEHTEPKHLVDEARLIDADEGNGQSLGFVVDGDFVCKKRFNRKHYDMEKLRSRSSSEYSNNEHSE